MEDKNPSGCYCGQCNFAGSDVKLSPCGCTLHAKCVPIELIVAAPASNGGNVAHSQGHLTPQQPHTIMCPVCHSSPVSKLELFPMTTELLDKAVTVKKRALENNGQQKKADELDEIHTESTYLILSHNSASSSSSTGLSTTGSGATDFYRTGRWTEEEMEFVEFLLNTFDSGKLPLPVGVRLNDFLCSVLLCKSSRLTKKMKNARLSIRSYEINNHSTAQAQKLLDCELFTTLQEKFLQSVSNDAGQQYELRFNMDKAWRTNLSNLCVQVSSQILNADTWFASLEELENRAALAEENIRKLRRRRMGLALKTDVKQPHHGVYFSGIPVQKPTSNKKKTEENPTPTTSASSHGHLQEATSSDVHSSSTHTVTSSDRSETCHHINKMLDLGENHPDPSVVPDTVEDFAVIFNDLIGDGNNHHHVADHRIRNDCGSFLDAVLAYMEQHELPFQHVDVWVPSYTPQSLGRPEDLRLFHAGHATREELDPSTFNQLREYGEYSTKFSFAPSCGLPGRVYSSGQPSWECRLDEADPEIFERAGGATVYGVKTGIGIPISSSFIGRLVVSMYSLQNLPAQPDLLSMMTTDLAEYCPKPKWKLVVEMASDSEGGTSELPKSSSVSSRHEEQAPSSGTRRSATERSNSVSSQQSSSGSALTERVVDEREEDMRIAALLGDHMPGANLPAPGQPTAPCNAPDVMLTHFMSLRLLLLRSPERRSAEDNTLLEVIRKSYRGFSKDHTRSPKDIADLLARDWRFLRTSELEDESSQKPAANKQEEFHQSHMMKSPKLNTFVSTGVPAKVPFPLGVGNNSKPTAVRQLSSSLYEDGGCSEAKKRRISSIDEDDQFDSVPPMAVKIVDEA